MNVNLDELMRLREEATPGPWEHKIDDYFTTIHTIEPSVASYVSPADAAYIVAACNAVPELVQKIRELLKNHIETLEEYNQFLRKHIELRKRFNECKEIAIIEGQIIQELLAKGKGPGRSEEAE